MRREFSSGKRLRFNKRGEWVSPLFDNASMLRIRPDVSDETWAVIKSAIARAEPQRKK